MGWSRPDEDTRADHYRDERKHDTPAHRFDKPLGEALEIAALCRDVPITRAAELIELYAQTVAEKAKLDVAVEMDQRIGLALESPLTPANYGGE